MTVVRSTDRPVQRRPKPWPLLQKVVTHEVGATALTLLANWAEPGDSVRFHHHDVEEILYVVAGRMRVEMNDEVLHVGTGDALIVPANVVHAFANPGPERLMLVGVLASATAQTVWQDETDPSGRHLDQIPERA